MLSKIINCQQCGQIFIPRKEQRLCPLCTQKEERIFQKVRDYIRTHPGQNVWEVAKGAGVSSEIVLAMIKQGSLFG